MPGQMRPGRLGPEPVTHPPVAPPPPPAPRDSLIEAYARWRERQEATTTADPLAKARDVSPGEIEAQAWHRSRRKVAQRLAKGDKPVKALATGFRRYRKLGGRMALATWHRKLLGP